MSSPRPDTAEVKEIVESETDLDWTVVVDDPDKIQLTCGPWNFDIEWEDNRWVFRIYDRSSSKWEATPQWAQGGMSNATEVKNELPGFIPDLEQET